MKILVTGCAGFIGSSLTKKLTEIDNIQVLGIDNLSAEHSSVNINNLIKLANFDFFKGDITDEGFLNSVFKVNSVDVVIHLAGKAGVRQSILNPFEYVSTNIGGTVNILQQMQKNNVKKMIFASSSSVYGNSSSEVFTENLKDLIQISPYAKTKKVCEEFIEMYSKLYGIQAVCLRFFTVYGPNQRPDLAIRKFTNLILNNQPIPLYGDGTSYRDYTYIDDVVDGIIKASDYTLTPFEIINLGSASPIKLKDMVFKIEKELNKVAKIDYLSKQVGDVDRTIADISKAKRLLGYYPKVSFDEGLHRFVNEFCHRE